jgi:hypothetical protein
MIAVLFESLGALGRSRTYQRQVSKIARRHYEGLQRLLGRLVLVYEASVGRRRNHP